MHSKNCTNKTCQQQQPIPVTEFHKSNRSKDGYQSWCKVCMASYKKTYQPDLINRLRRKNLPANLKYCGNKKCKQDNPLPTKAFYKDKSSPSGLVSYCKKCEKERHMKNNPARLAYMREWMKNNPRESKKVKAVTLVNYHARIGKIPHIATLTCDDCGIQAEHYHHPDYDKPLDVVPLCCTCHFKRHAL